MAFTIEQKAALSSPLNASAVKQRSQGGRSLSYIEGWHAIAEANRIFGFDAWSRETVETKCVSERERSIGKERAQGWGVTYIARVRITLDGIVREGCGAGHGIDRDLGQAHESAIKEAETDAMKRALMTFGNPFGLALYDRTQANVSHDIADTMEETALPPFTVSESAAVAKKMMEGFKSAENVKALIAYKGTAEFKAAWQRITADDAETVGTAYGDRKAELEGA